MIANVNIPFSSVYINSILFFISIFTLQVNAETKIIAKNGDTLYKISRQYDVSLKELMYKNDFNDAEKIIEGEVVILPQKNNSLNRKDQNITYKVVEGDTLYKIARNYNINVKDIISINNLDNKSLLRPDQIIILPKGAEYKKVISKKNINLANKKVFYHQTSKIEDISTIAEIHRIATDEIKTLNNLKNTKKINPNTKLQIRKNKTSKWLKYGSLTINWADWTYFDGNYMAKAKTKKNTFFYLAVSCKKRTLNNTLNNSHWKSWYFPENDFEVKLINDFCEKDFKI